MKIWKDSIYFQTSKGISFLDITDSVENIVLKSKVREGITFIFAPHATGAIIINENDRALLGDIKSFLERLVSQDGFYEHPQNAPSHIISSLLTPSHIIPVYDGRLALGTWQSILWVEVEPWPRNRKVMVIVIGE
ncbi:MAG: secondary thiamine-phosphate synthase enzyme YjbQ [Nitrososphaeria archaeon]